MIAEQNRQIGVCVVVGGGGGLSFVALDMLKNMAYVCDPNVLPNAEPHK